MKKLIRRLCTPATKKVYFFFLMIIGILFTTITNAQWQNKASGFSTPQRGIVELIAVGNNVVWGIASDAVNPIYLVAPFTDFTRTIDGGKNWTAGNINAFPDFFIAGIAPLSATVCYASLANFENGIAKIVKTTDGGITWTEQLNYDFGVSFSFFADIYFFN